MRRGMMMRKMMRRAMTRGGMVSKDMT